MKRSIAAALLCLCWAVHGVAENAEPKWRVNLRERYEFQAFDRTINFRWTLHQDVLFISPDRVLVYQVNRARGPAHLGPRDASGGAGNFTLAIRVLNAQDGKEMDGRLGFRPRAMKWRWSISKSSNATISLLIQGSKKRKPTSRC
jgi:hypothetical protein